MRHNRPEAPWTSPYYGEHRLRVGWRREHADRVWQAAVWTLFCAAWQELSNGTSCNQDDAIRFLEAKHGWPGWQG